uniref:C2H2-type domain-containing protein n=1 Tax=Rhabditophanes sp. KR3021 TaxID=114890 RepID=A0AC35TGH0_9BILA
MNVASFNNLSNTNEVQNIIAKYLEETSKNCSMAGEKVNFLSKLQSTGDFSESFPKLSPPLSVDSTSTQVSSTVTEPRISVEELIKSSINRSSARTRSQVGSNLPPDTTTHIKDLFNRNATLVGDINGFGMDQSYLTSGVNGLPIMNLKCTECGVVKTTSEDLEVHIKTEHLNWLPFECPTCFVLRASDNQMREHVHSVHRQNITKFSYIDNDNARRTLQLMMDRSLFSAASIVGPAKGAVNGTVKNGTTPVSTRRGSTSSVAPKKLDNLLFSKMASVDIPTPNLANSLLSLPQTNGRKRPPPPTNFLAALNNDSTAATEALLASFTNPTPFNDLMEVTEQQGIQNATIQDQLSAMFGGVFNKDPPTALDLKLNETTTSTIPPLDSTFLSTVSALFGGDTTLPGGPSTSLSLMDEGESKRQKVMAKKRVLGLCSRCNKPVTAGSRQVHIFYHLGKDYGHYRFRCLFPDCNTSHYRKDQLESHMIKVHGGINVGMLEDCSQQLSAACNELSMELLGTSNNNPGPTAAEAQIVFEELQKEALEQMNKKRKRRKGGDGKFFLPKMMLNSMGGKSGDNSNAEMLECKLCKKEIMAKIKGFHLLYHVSKTYGFSRFSCKYCEFSHDRSCMVRNHAKASHDDENGFVDMMHKNADLVKKMSEDCFGSMVLSMVAKNYVNEDNVEGPAMLAIPELKDDLDEAGPSGSHAKTEFEETIEETMEQEEGESDGDHDSNESD